jgi:hypothetical protein
MKRLVKVQAVPPSTLRLTFGDRRKAEIDVAELLSYEAFAPLSDPEVFGRAQVDEIGGIYWPNGADLSPEWIDEKASKSVGSPSTL